MPPRPARPIRWSARKGRSSPSSIFPDKVGSATGTASPAGVFQVAAADGTTLSGQIDPSATTLTATLTVAGQTPQMIAGLSELHRTDRPPDQPLLPGRRGNGGQYPDRGLRGCRQRERGSPHPRHRPGLGAFGLSGTLASPHLRLYNSAGALLFENDGWGGQAGLAQASAQAGAFPLDAGGKDAALLVSLPPGIYTAQISDPASTGIALAEIYDASQNPQANYQRLANISSRGWVGSGNNILIGGFIVSGNSPKKVLIRGVGPGLAAVGLSGDAGGSPARPHRPERTVIATNNDWGVPVAVGTTQKVASPPPTSPPRDAAAGAFALPSGSKDSALLVYLVPGAYTAQVSAADGGKRHRAARGLRNRSLAPAASASLASILPRARAGTEGRV